MAGLSGNAAWLGVSLQALKGTPAATVQHKIPFAGGNIEPVREMDKLEETDSSRDSGASYVSTSGVEGDPEVYVRDTTIALFLYAALGAKAVTGTAPNFTHTLTPSTTLPMLTIWRNLGNLLYERFSACKVNSLSISAEAGQPLSATVEVEGIGTVRLTTDPAPAVALSGETVFNYNNAAVLLGGAATSLVSSFELTIENNIERQQTDDVEPYDISVGQREISLGFDLIFEDLTEYNKFHYGGASGTTISPNVFTTSADFTFTLGVNNEVKFTLPSIAYEEFPVEPDPGGDPVVASVRAMGQRSASPMVTAVVKNQTATYTAI